MPPARDHRSGNVDVVLKCAAGLEDVIARAATADCRAFRQTETESGFVRGSVPRQSLGRVLALPYATWTGVGLRSVTKKKATNVNTAVRAVDPDDLMGAARPKRTTSFRFRCLDDNQLVAVEDKAIKETIRTIERQIPQLRYDPRDARIEVWIVRRRGTRHFEGFARRVTKRRSTRGALDDDVASALVRVFDPKPDDVFLDPFAGFGTIPAARSKYPAEWIGACDIAPPKSPLFPIERADFLSTKLDRYLDGRKPNLVVTDLPWGNYEASLDVKTLYDQVCTRLEEIGGPHLRCALLVARDPQLVERLTEWLHKPQEPRTVLIHGRKATLLAGTAPTH